MIGGSCGDLYGRICDIKAGFQGINLDVRAVRITICHEDEPENRIRLKAPFQGGHFWLREVYWIIDTATSWTADSATATSVTLAFMNGQDLRSSGE